MLINRNFSKGFTLIELMIVVVLISVIVLIAMPNYQQYVRRAEASQVQQEMQNIAMELEKSKNRNFNYLGFEKGNTANQISFGKYVITVRDGSNTSLDLTHDKALGQSWVILAQTTDAKNFNFLFTSSGLKCKTYASSTINYSDCGNDSEAW